MIRESLVRGAIELIETGWLPDSFTRAAIRHLCRRRLASLSRTGDVEQHLLKFTEEARSGPIAPVPEQANQQHYEVPAEFYSYVLGRHRKYSCC